MDQVKKSTFESKRETAFIRLIKAQDKNNSTDMSNIENQIKITAHAALHKLARVWSGKLTKNG